MPRESLIVCSTCSSLRPSGRLSQQHLGAFSKLLSGRWPPPAGFLAFAVPSILSSVVLAWSCRKLVERATTWRRQLFLAIGFTLAGGFLTGVVFAFEGAIDAIGHGRQELLQVLTVYPLYGVLGAILSLPLTGAVAFAGVLALRWAAVRGRGLKLYANGERDPGIFSGLKNSVGHDASLLSARVVGYFDSGVISSNAARTVFSIRYQRLLGLDERRRRSSQ